MTLNTGDPWAKLQPCLYCGGVTERRYVQTFASGHVGMDHLVVFCPTCNVKAPCTPPAPNPSAAGRR